MLKRLTICMLILLVTAGISTAQLYYVNLPPGHNKITLGDDRIPGVKGSPYLSDEWSMGTITLHNGSVIDSLEMRYNVFAGEIHYKHDGNVYILGSPDSVRYISMYGERYFVYLPYTDKKEGTLKDYFEFLSGDVAQLLVRHTVTKIKSNYNVALDVGEKDDRLEHKNAYYLRKDKSIVLIDRKGETVLDLLSDKSRELRDFVSRNRLSFTREADLKRIVDHYNSFHKN